MEELVSELSLSLELAESISETELLSGGDGASEVDTREELVSELSLSLELAESIGETELLSGGDGVSEVDSREELVSELSLSLELAESIGETELLSGSDGASESVSASSVVVEEGDRRGCSVDDEDTSAVEKVIASSLMLVDDACKTAVLVDEVIDVGGGDGTVDVAMTTVVIVTDGMTKSDDCDIGCASELVDSDDSVTEVLVGASDGILEVEEVTSGIST